MAPLSYPTFQKLQRLEVSLLGIHQLAAGVPVTDRRDRDLLLNVLEESSRWPGRLFLPRVGWEGMLRSGRSEDRRRIAEVLDIALSLRRSA
jgi:hypothetical protein